MIEVEGRLRALLSSIIETSGHWRSSLQFFDHRCCLWFYDDDDVVAVVVVLTMVFFRFHASRVVPTIRCAK